MLNILMDKILGLALVMGAGFCLVKWGPLDQADTRSLSRLTCYLIMPCSIFGAFHMERTPEILRGLALVLLGALLVHGLYLSLAALLRRPLKLSPVEQASAFCTNAGNLIIPLVAASLGQQWVIFTCAYILVQTVLLWSHVKNLVCGDRGMDLSALLKNPNILALVAGTGLFLLDLRLPRLLEDTVTGIASMVGPSAMLVIGMTMGSLSLGQVVKKGRVWLVTGLRLLVFPLLALGLLKLLTLGIPGTAPYFLITMLAASAPSAAVITHICQLYGRDPGDASAICTLTTGLSVVTIPLMVYLYSLVTGL